MKTEKGGDTELTPEQIAEVVDIMMPWIPDTDREKKSKPDEPEIKNIVNNM